MDWEELYGDFYGYGDDPDSLVIRPNCPSLGDDCDYGDESEGEAGFEDEGFSVADGDDWDFGDWESDAEDSDDCGSEDGDGDYATREENL